MITLKEFLETIEYRITESDDYCWACYGPNTRSISSWNGLYEDGGWSFDVVFDTKNQTVYEVTVCDYTNNRAYRLIHPDFKTAYEQEAKSRDVDDDQAWDDVDYTDLETVEDWIEKARAIVEGREYDTRVSIPIDIPDDDLFTLMKMAHLRDITLNQMIEEVLREQIERLKDDLT